MRTDDESIEKAILGVLAVADANFPASTDITISVSGENTASVRLPSYVLRGIMETAKHGKSE